MRRLIHLNHGFTHLRDTCRLLIAGGTDFTHDGRHLSNAAHNFLQSDSGLVDQQGSLFNPHNAGADEVLDFLGGRRRSSRQVAVGKAQSKLVGAQGQYQQPISNALQYMGLAPGEMGDDAHQYAWVDAYRDPRLSRRAA